MSIDIEQLFEPTASALHIKYQCHISFIYIFFVLFISPYLFNAQMLKYIDIAIVKFKDDGVKIICMVKN